MKHSDNKSTFPRLFLKANRMFPSAEEIEADRRFKARLEWERRFIKAMDRWAFGLWKKLPAMTLTYSDGTMERYAKGGKKIEEEGVSFQE